MPSLPELTNFAREAQRMIEAHRPFSVQQENGKLVIASERVSSAALALKTSDDLVNAALERLKVCNLKLLPKEEREGLRDLVDVAYRHIREQSKKYSFGKDKAAWDHLETLALNAKLGGKLSSNLLESSWGQDFTTFIQVNHLHHKVQALYQQLESLPGVMVNASTVIWYLMDKKEEFDALSKKVGYSFSYQGKELFKTDCNLKLTSDYSYTHEGIIKYNPISSPDVRAYDKQIGDGRYHLEIWTALYDVKGERPVITIGDHSHMALVDAQGNKFGVGQYGMADDFNCAHAVSACGRKKGGIETPDRYLLLAKDSHSFKKMEVDISRLDFDCLMDQIKKDKVDPNLSVSIIKGNCTGYVKTLLSKIGIDAPTEMGLVEALVRKTAPLSWIKKGDALWDSVKDKVPNFLKKAIYFLPPFYLVTFTIGMCVRFGSMRNFRNQPSDISFADAIFKPWNVWGHHPMALRRWQEKFPDKVDVNALRTNR